MLLTRSSFSPIRRRRGHQRSGRGLGFTLIEVMATVVVLGTIGTVASMTIFTAINGYIRAATQAQLHTELSVTLDRIERELRKIPIKVAYGSIAPDLTSISSNSIAWSGNSSLSLVGTELRFVESGAPQAVLLNNVTAFAVQGFNENNVWVGAMPNLAARDSIRRISVQITIQRYGITETLRTKVFLRCTMKGAES